MGPQSRNNLLAAFGVLVALWAGENIDLTFRELGEQTAAEEIEQQRVDDIGRRSAFAQQSLEAECIRRMERGDDPIRLGVWADEQRRAIEEGFQAELEGKEPAAHPATDQGG